MTGIERREQLLDIGRRLFAERGFEGTSIEEIAAQAGVSKPVVYEHFGGKEGLYAVVVAGRGGGAGAARAPPPGRAPGLPPGPNERREAGPPARTHKKEKQTTL